MANRTVYVSGCIGNSVDTGKLVPGGVVAQTEQALTHLKNILLASGSNMSSVVKATLFITDFNDFDSINEVYKKCMYASRYMKIYTNFAQLILLRNVYSGRKQF